MAKKVLLILGAVFLFCIASCGVVLFWALRSGSEMQDEFFAAVVSGDPKQVTSQFDPALVEEVDEPVLAAWMQAVTSELGRYQGLSPTDFNTSTKYADGATITESKGTVNFEKGTATSELVFRNGRLVQFSITSDQLTDGWFQGPSDSQLYRQRGERFLTHFLSDEQEPAYAMMHEALQKQVPMDTLQEMIRRATADAGRLKSLSYQSESFDTSDGERLRLRYRVACENQEMDAEVNFQFLGMKGHLMGFNVTPLPAEGSQQGVE